jgi:hypothetical protein
MLQTIEFESSDKFVQAFSSDGLPVSLGLRQVQCYHTHIDKAIVPFESFTIEVGSE